jgi:hypothetical protein
MARDQKTPPAQRKEKRRRNSMPEHSQGGGRGGKTTMTMTTTTQRPNVPVPPNETNKSDRKTREGGPREREGEKGDVM